MPIYLIFRYMGALHIFQGLDNKVFQQTYSQNWFATCGRDCSDLISKRLSRSANEDFADWAMVRALELRLKREPTLAKRREMAAHSTAFFCSVPSVLRDASALTNIEKKHSFEPHPDDRARLIRFFTPAVSELLGCASGIQDLGEKACEL